MKRLLKRLKRKRAVEPSSPQSSSVEPDEIHGRAGGSLPAYEQTLLPDPAAALSVYCDDAARAAGNRRPRTQGSQGTRTFDVD